MAALRKIVVFTGDPSYSVRKGIVEIEPSACRRHVRRWLRRQLSACSPQSSAPRRTRRLLRLDWHRERHGAFSAPRAPRKSVDTEMSWGQLRSMRRAGFTIASHSVNHIDCAAESAAVVRDELAQSRDDLRRELGACEPILAYPYGGVRHMTPQRLDMVKAAGYTACLSAYGGSNIGSVDRYNVLRRGIHWEFSDDAFLLHFLGLR